MPSASQAIRIDRARIGQESESACPRARVLRLEHSRVIKRVRSELRLSREAVADVTDSSPKAVRMWEDGETTPRLHQLAIAPRDLSLPLLAWAAAQQGLQVLDAPNEDASPEALQLEFGRACGDVVRLVMALNLDSDAPGTLDLYARVSRRMANAALAVNAHAMRRKGGR